MTVDVAASVAAWLGLQQTLTELATDGYRVPCADLTHLFVSDNRHDRRAAVAWCVGCPALDACHTYAEAAAEPLWVWGGRDRAPLYRGHNKPKENH